MINFKVSFLWIVVRLWFFFLFSGLPPSVNSMQVPPNTPRGMSSAQVKISTVNITCEVEGWVEINKEMNIIIIVIIHFNWCGKLIDYSFQLVWETYWHLNWFEFSVQFLLNYLCVKTISDWLEKNARVVS